MKVSCLHSGGGAPGKSVNVHRHLLIESTSTKHQEKLTLFLLLKDKHHFQNIKLKYINYSGYLFIICCNASGFSSLQASKLFQMPDAQTLKPMQTKTQLWQVKPPDFLNTQVQTGPQPLAGCPKECKGHTHWSLEFHHLPSTVPKVQYQVAQESHMGMFHINWNTESKGGISLGLRPAAQGWFRLDCVFEMGGGGQSLC